MKIFLTLSTVLLVIGVSVPAAAPDDDAERSSSVGEVLARLASSDPASTAWGAYLAGRDGHRDAIPSILEVLGAHREFDPDPWRLTYRSALDALIRLEADVPAALLSRHDRRLSVHVLILRSLDPQTHADALLERFQKAARRTHMGHIGLATGNLLLQIRAAGFAACLLRGIRMRLAITVFTPGPDDGFGGGSGVRVFGGSGDGMARVPDGFPPYVWYQLMHRRGRADKLLANGPRPVFYERRERATRGLAVGGPISRVEVPVASLEWMGALLGEDEEPIGIETKRSLPVGWTTAEVYLERAVAAREKLLAPYWKVAKRLVDEKCLTLAEARDLEPQVEIHVKDERTDQSKVIPPLPAPTRPAWIEGAHSAK